MRKTSYIKSTFMAIIVTLFLISFVGALSTSGAIETSNPAIYVTDTSGRPGDEVTVNIEMKNSPGVAGIIINVIFDNDKLTLEQIEYGAEFETGCDLPQTYTSPVILSWGDLSEKDGNLTFAKLTFKINKDISTDSITNIRVEYKDSNIIDINEESVQFDIHNGEIVISTGLPGDINGDGEVNAKDLLRLRKYFAGWNVVVDGIAVDVNGDGDANAKDLLRLRKYFAGWEVEIFYGAKSNSKCAHLMERIPAVQTGCTESGNFEYWHCEKCGKYFSDANGNTEITLESTVIPATGHTYSDEWSYDEQYHWHAATCEHTDEKDGMQGHILNDNVCEICGYRMDLTVTFIDYNNSIIDMIKIPYGGTAGIQDLPYPSREGYVFIGWDKPLNNVTEDVTVKAIYNRQFTVSFVDFDGNSIDELTQKVESGKKATKPKNLSDTDKYEFIDWNYNFDVPITSDVVVAPLSEIQKYEVTFVMPDGTEIPYTYIDGNGEEKQSIKQTVEYGFSPVVPDYPDYYFDWNRTEKNAYSLSGWKYGGKTYNDLSKVKISGDTEFEAIYDTPYNTPVVALSFGAPVSNEQEVTLTICVPSGYKIYALDLSVLYDAPLLITNQDRIVIPSSLLSIEDEYGNIVTPYVVNNKMRKFTVTYSDANGKELKNSFENVITLKFSINSGVTANKDTVKVAIDQTAVVIGKNEANLQKITPIVVYR